MGLEGVTWTEIALASGIFALAFLLGIIAGRAGNQTRLKARRLAEELEREREQHAAYQDAVAKHFGQTSELFRDLTHQYTSLYAHLAEGSRELCADRAPALGWGFPDTSLQLDGGPAGAVSDEPDADAPDADAPPEAEESTAAKPTGDEPLA